MNKVFLVGRLSSDPISRTTGTGKEVVSITLAVNDNRNKDESFFFPCVAWTTSANFINTYLKKGDMVAVDGRLTKRSYVNKEGKTTYITEIMVDTINSLVKNKSNDDSGILKKYDKHITEKIENEEQEEDFANIIHNVNGGNN